jgi:MFS family permease
LYNPPKRKMISRLLKNNGLIEGNSLLVGITGFSFVIGPILAGIMINSYGLNSAFIVNSLSFFISAVILIYIKLPNIKYEWKSKAKESLSEGIKYFTSSPKIIELVIMGTVIIFCTAIANMTFFRFAFDILQVSSREWGFMMSLFYGTNLLTMLIAQFIGKKVNKNIAPSFFLSLIAVTITWLLYGITSNLYTVMLLQVIEGTALCFFGIVLISCLQYNIKSSYMARIIGISDIVNNFGKIFGAGLAFMLLNYYNYKLIFIVNSIMLSIFVFYKMMFSKRLVK